MSVNLLLSVAAGGAVGAVGRYLVMSGIGHWLPGVFPLATLSVNVIGSFVLGAVIEVMAFAWSPSPEIRAMVVVGILGAFTTFSTFSLDVYYLIERNAFQQAGFYILTSVVFSIAAFIAGLFVFRNILT